MNTNRNRLSEILIETMQAMRIDLYRNRAAYTHAGTKGEAAEEVVQEFLRNHLPKSLGVTSGQAIDSNGKMSGQLDVIIYDALRTPMLFTSPKEQTNLVPIEGVIAVIEVKSLLKKSHIQEIFSSCQKVKSLEKKSYLRTPDAITNVIYGRTWVDAPVYFSIFAFESENAYAKELNSVQEGAPLHGRIDLVCYLDRGLSLNCQLEPKTLRPRLTGFATPGSFMVDTSEKSMSLIHWYALFSNVVSQINVRPIDLFGYLEGDLSTQISVPLGDMPKDLLRGFLETINAQKSGNAGHREDPQGAPVKWIMEFIENFSNYQNSENPDAMTEGDRRLMEEAKRVAKNLQ